MVWANIWNQRIIEESSAFDFGSDLLPNILLTIKNQAGKRTDLNEAYKQLNV